MCVPTPSYTGHISTRHQYTVQGFDPSGSHTSILDVCIRVTDNIVNYSVPINFNHEYFNIIPAIISTLPYLYVPKISM